MKTLWAIYFRPRMWRMLLLGFSSGLPLALISTTLQAWYTVSGISIITIGFLGLIGQPYAYKFFWAPLMDRYVPPFLGRRRGWMLITQCLLFVSIASMAFFNPQTAPLTLAFLALLVAFFSASQDICLDAYRTDILTPEERGAGSAMWVSGYRIALLISGGIALILASYLGWHVMLLLMAAAMLVGIITTLFSEPTAQDDIHPLSLRAAILDPLREFWQRPYIVAILLFIILYKLGDAFALSLNTTFYLRGLGFSLIDVGSMMKVMNLLGNLVGLFIGGIWMLRLGLYRALLYFGIFQAITNVFYIFLALAGKNYFLLATSIFVENLSGGMGSAAFLAFLMALCDVRYTATQLALLSALMSVGRVFVGPLAGVVVEHIGWIEFFIWSLVLSLPGLFLLYWLRDRVNFNLLFSQHKNN